MKLYMYKYRAFGLGVDILIHTTGCTNINTQALIHRLTNNTKMHKHTHMNISLKMHVDSKNEARCKYTHRGIQ